MNLHVVTSFDADLVQRDLVACYGPALLQLRRGARIVDVGAHVGLFQLMLNDASLDAHSLCFEPSEELFDCLVRNLAQLRHVRAVAHRLAAGRAAGLAEYWYRPRLPQASSLDCACWLQSCALEEARRTCPWAPELLRRWYVRWLLRAQKRTVPVVRLEGYLLEPVDLLKVDVEGHELDVLEGVGSSWPLVRAVVAEAHTHDAALRACALLGAQGLVARARAGPMPQLYVIDAVRADTP